MKDRNAFISPRTSSFRGAVRALLFAGAALALQATSAPVMAQEAASAALPKPSFDLEDPARIASGKKRFNGTPSGQRKVCPAQPWPTTLSSPSR